ncbi:MAG: hypothetical protein NTW86_13365 [Candidatus Sumerlaeota bacterium]|nr:hypothetical protein [Candidatus Sumerlaeota bacterium]
MVAHELIRAAERWLENVKQLEHLSEFLNRVVQIREETVSRLGEMVAVPSKAPPIADQLRRTLDEKGNLFAEVPADRLFGDVQSLRKTFREHFGSGFGANSEVAGVLDRTLGVFNEGLNKWYQSKRAPKDTIDLIFLGCATQAALSHVTATIGAFADALQASPCVSPGQDEAPFSLELESSGDLREFAEKILTVQKLYSHCCLMLEVSEAQFPLRILKIESGSEYIAVLGSTAVLGFIGWIIREVGGFLHRQYTNEGRIRGIAAIHDALDKHIELTAKMRDLGANVEGSREQLGESLGTLTRYLGALIEHAAKVVVNDEPVVIINEDILVKALFSGGNSLRIEQDGGVHGTDSRKALQNAEGDIGQSGDKQPES